MAFPHASTLPTLFRIRATLRACATFLVVPLLLVPAAHGQFSASLRGTVTDPSGAVIPGATVTLINKDTNQTRSSTSDSKGLYTVEALGPGTYRVLAQRDGSIQSGNSDFGVARNALGSRTVQLQARFSF